MCCKKLESQDDEAYVTGKRKPKEKGVETPGEQRKAEPFSEKEEVLKDVPEESGGEKKRTRKTRGDAKR